MVRISVGDCLPVKVDVRLSGEVRKRFPGYFNKRGKVRKRKENAMSKIKGVAEINSTVAEPSNAAALADAAKAAETKAQADIAKGTAEADAWLSSLYEVLQAGAALGAHAMERVVAKIAETADDKGSPSPSHSIAWQAMLANRRDVTVGVIDNLARKCNAHFAARVPDAKKGPFDRSAEGTLIKGGSKYALRDAQKRKLALA